MPKLASHVHWKVGEKIEWYIEFSARDTEDKSQAQYHVASDRMELTIMDPGNAHGFGQGGNGKGKGGRLWASKFFRGGRHHRRMHIEEFALAFLLIVVCMLGCILCR